MNMVYAKAAYHDTGLTADRKTHHIVYGRVVREDMWLRCDHTPEESFNIMVDHPASRLPHASRSQIVKLLS